jgi:hypothetical protein
MLRELKHKIMDLRPEVRNPSKWGPSGTFNGLDIVTTIPTNYWRKYDDLNRKYDTGAYFNIGLVFKNPEDEENLFVSTISKSRMSSLYQYEVDGLLDAVYNVIREHNPEIPTWNFKGKSYCKVALDENTGFSEIIHRTLYDMRNRRINRNELEIMEDLINGVSYEERLKELLESKG